MTQAQALSILKTGANVFLTGEPGSGKTHTVNQYIAYLRSKEIEPDITASTGIAATHIGGVTIHSWSGIGIKKQLTAQDLDAIGQNKNVVTRIGAAKILIIDEVSMLSAQTLSMIEAVCREVKKKDEPFGGIQVVLVGDFFQLPPVKKQGDRAPQASFEEFENEGLFAFQSRAWQAASPLICYLSEQYRQDDTDFLDLLSAIRRRGFTEEHKQQLRTCYSPTPKDDIPQLYTHNINVDRINNQKLNKLATKEERFVMKRSGREKLVDALVRGCLSPEILVLKKGAKVMFTKNDISGKRFVNGTLGEVKDFTPVTRQPIITTAEGVEVIAEPSEWRIEDNGQTVAKIEQIPLRLAWAITVHKSQGMSLDGAHMDLSSVFEYGQGYVALSRVRTLQGLSLAGLNEKAVEIHPDVCASDEEFREDSKRVAEQFQEISKQELEAMQKNFINACGGNPDGRVLSKKKHKPSTYDNTLVLIKEGLTISQIATRRDVTEGTIITHLEKLQENEQIGNKEIMALLPKKITTGLSEINKVFDDIGLEKLTPAHKKLRGKYSFDNLRLARVVYRSDGGSS